MKKETVERLLKAQQEALARVKQHEEKMRAITGGYENYIVILSNRWTIYWLAVRQHVDEPGLYFLVPCVDDMVEYWDYPADWETSEWKFHFGQGVWAREEEFVKRAYEAPPGALAAAKKWLYEATHAEERRKYLASLDHRKVSGLDDSRWISGE